MMRPRRALAVACRWACCLLVAIGAPAPTRVGAVLPGQGTGTLEGTVKIPWARSSANALIAIHVEDATLAPIDPAPALDQRELRFVPHVLPIVVGTTVRFTNSDPLLHNIFSPSERVTAFNLGSYRQGIERRVTFDRSGEVLVLCNVHSQMSAWILVLLTEHFALTDEAGRFRVENLPVGEHRVWVWAETAQPIERQVKIVDRGTTREAFVFEQRRRGGWIGE